MPGLAGSPVLSSTFLFHQSAKIKLLRPPGCSLVLASTSPGCQDRARRPRPHGVGMADYCDRPMRSRCAIKAEGRCVGSNRQIARLSHIPREAPHGSTSAVKMMRRSMPVRRPHASTPVANATPVPLPPRPTAGLASAAPVAPLGPMLAQTWLPKGRGQDWSLAGYQGVA